MDNIDLFNKTVGVIFSDLYEAHPLPVNFDIPCMESRIASKPDKQNPEEFNYAFDVADQCFYTFDFLQRTGFIECGRLDLQLRAAEDVKFTLSGYNVLSDVPFGESTKSLGEELAEVVKEGAKGRLKEVVGKVLQPSNAVMAMEALKTYFAQ